MTDPGELDDIRDAAVAWVVALQSPDLADDALVAFDAWLEASSEHRRAYEAALETWLQCTDLPPPAPVTVRPSVSARGARPLGRQTPRRFVGGAIAASALAAVIGLGWIFKPPTPQATIIYQTAKGERRELALSDGTRLALNSATRVAVDLRPDSRRLRVESGEIAVKVAHVPDRPFSVETQGLLIRDVGTEFDVRSRPDGVSITVAQGIVDVAGIDGGRSVRLVAGERFVRPTATQASRVETDAADEGFGWKHGELVLRDEPMGAVVAELNNYFDRPIRIADPALARRRVTGVLRLSDEVTTLRALSLFAPLRVTRATDAVVLTSAEPSP